MVWPASISSATPGAVAAAADFNNHRDALNAAGDAWTAYTPSLTASTTDPTLGSASLTGRYRLVGKTVDIHIHLTLGAGFTAGSGSWRFGLPSGMTPLHANASESMGSATVRDASPATTYTFSVHLFSSSAVALARHDTGASIASAAPITWASGDMVSIHIPSLELA